MPWIYRVFFRLAASVSTTYAASLLQTHKRNSRFDIRKRRSSHTRNILTEASTIVDHVSGPSDQSCHLAIRFPITQDLPECGNSFEVRGAPSPFQLFLLRRSLHSLSLTVEESRSTYSNRGGKQIVFEDLSRPSLFCLLAGLDGYSTSITSPFQRLGDDIGRKTGVRIKSACVVWTCCRLDCTTHKQVWKGVCHGAEQRGSSLSRPLIRHCD